VANLVSVVIPCKNEEQNISACLASVRELADEIVVADSGSTDRTLDLVRPLSDCRLVEREFISFSSFKNWAIEQAIHPWVLTLDADERLTAESAREIRQLLDGTPAHDGYRIRRANHFLGHALHYGPARRDWPLRLFRREVARYNDRQVHESVIISTGRVGNLKHPMIHFPFWTIAEHARKGDRYTDLAAEEMHARGKRVGFVKLLTAWPLRFAKAYLLQRGFLDGTPGLVYAILSASYTTNKYVKLWGLAKHLNRDSIDPQPDLARREDE